MKIPDGIQPLTLTFIVKDSDSWGGDEDCASFYRTSRGSFVVQGDRREEPEVVAQARSFDPGREGLLEVPETLVDPFVRIYVREVYGIDLGEPAQGVDRSGA